MISSTPTATWEYKELQSCDIHHSTHLHPTGVCSLKASHHISHGNPGLMKPLLGSRRGPGWGLGLMAHGLVGTYGCRDEMFCNRCVSIAKFDSPIKVQEWLNYVSINETLAGLILLVTGDRTVNIRCSGGTENQNHLWKERQTPCSILPTDLIAFVSRFWSSSSSS